LDQYTLLSKAELSRN